MESMVELPDSPLSLWLAEYGDYEPTAPLEGELEADVAIVGGGFLGMSTALALKRRDPALEVAVLEAREVGYGASGRNGSFAMTVVGLGFGTTALIRGKRFLKAAHTYMEGCVDELERFIDSESIDCDKIRPGFLRVATTPSYVKRLQHEVELMGSLGFDGIEWIDADATAERVRSERYLGAMWERRLALINPAKLVREERRLALAAGVRVFEGTPVEAITRDRASGAIRLSTPAGAATAPKLALATNAYSQQFGPLARKQQPAFTYMIATAPLTEAQLDSIGWEGREGIEDARNLIHYYRLTPDRRIAMGGGPVGLPGGGRLDFDRSESAWAHLEEHVRWLWPQLEGVEITHRWGGPFSVTADLTPALGYIGGGRDAVYGLGCIGHGVSMSYRNGDVLADLLVGDGSHAAECPFVNRRVLPWPPEPIATGVKHAIRGYLLAEDAFHERVLARL